MARSVSGAPPSAKKSRVEIIIPADDDPGSSEFIIIPHFAAFHPCAYHVNRRDFLELAVHPWVCAAETGGMIQHKSAC